MTEFVRDNLGPIFNMRILILTLRFKLNVLVVEGNAQIVDTLILALLFSGHPYLGAPHNVAFKAILCDFDAQDLLPSQQGHLSFPLALIRRTTLGVTKGT